MPVVSGVFLAIVLIPAAAASVSAFLLARNIRRLAAIAGAGLVLAAVFSLAGWLGGAALGATA